MCSRVNCIPTCTAPNRGGDELDGVVHQVAGQQQRDGEDLRVVRLRHPLRRSGYNLPILRKANFETPAFLTFY